MPPETTTVGPNSEPTTSTLTSNGSAPTSTASTNGANWLPEDVVKQYPSLTKFKDAPALAKSYAELEKLQGGSIRLPGKDAVPEDWEKFYARLGRPEAPDKYEIKFADDLKVDDNLVSSFRGQAHKLGLTQQQAAGLAEWFAGQSAGLVETQAGAIQQDLAKWEQELKSEWGYMYDRNVTLAARAFANLTEGKPDHPLAKLMDETGLGNHPAVLQFFADMGKKLGEDQFIDGDVGPSEEDVNSAREEIARIMNDMASPYWKGDKVWVDKVQKLHEIIAAGMRE